MRRHPSETAAGAAENRRGRAPDMDLEAIYAKTPATLDEIRARVASALDRHPLCRGVQFEVVSMPRTRKGNWTVSLRSVAPSALWEASHIVADIQEAYDLASAA
jgi:hypothetical protein